VASRRSPGATRTRARQRFQPWVGNSPLMEREHEMLEQKTGPHRGRGQAGQPIGPSSIAAWRPLDPPTATTQSSVEQRRTILRARARLLAQEEEGDKELFESPLEVVEFPPGI